MTDAAAGLFARNLAAFERHAPGVHAQLAKITTPGAALVAAPDGGTNLDLGHTMLYDRSAQAFFESQWARFAEKPNRISLNPPAQQEIGARVADRAMRKLYNYLREAGIGEVELQPRERAAYIVVFGVGLGLHLERLFDNFDFRNLIVIEQFPEFIWHSLHLVDWARILDGIVERGGTVRFLIGDDPQANAMALYWHMRSRDFGLIDGAYVYRHYSSYFLDETHDRFSEQLHVLLASKGFFEDEVKMLTNCFENLASCDFDLLEVKPRLMKPVPAFIVGSGPSIDRSFALLREMRDRAVIFSCGTTLRILLRNGIVPHFHCEMENVPAVYEHLEPLSREYDLSGLTMIAANTVDPRVPPLFGRKVIYFRELLSPTYMWGRPETALYGGAPNVSNLGARVAVTFGFKDIYFFGIDLGSRRKDLHHAKDAIYNKEWAKTYTRGIEPMAVEQAGNFGGKAYTNRVLLWARIMMQRITTGFPDRTFYNCSDGIRIDGTHPKLPHTIKLPPVEGGAEATVKRLHGELTPCHPRDILTREPIVAAREAMAVWREDMHAVNRRMKDEQLDFFDYYDAVRVIVINPDPSHTHRLIETMTVGSAMMLIQFAHFFFHRLGDDQLPKYTDAFVAAFDEAIDYMADEAIALFDRFIDRLDSDEFKAGAAVAS